jgi:hypothetical protein
MTVGLFMVELKIHREKLLNDSTITQYINTKNRHNFVGLQHLFKIEVKATPVD